MNSRFILIIASSLLAIVTVTTCMPATSQENNSASQEMDDVIPEMKPSIFRNPIADSIQRAMVILRNPNLPINRLLRHSMLHRFNQVHTKVNNNPSSDDPSASDPSTRIIQANPVVGAIETVGKLATLLVQIGEQVLPAIISNITLDNPAGLDRAGIDHAAGRAFVRALISGGPIEGDNKHENGNHAVSGGFDNKSSDEN